MQGKRAPFDFGALVEGTNHTTTQPINTTTIQSDNHTTIQNDEKNKGYRKAQTRQGKQYLAFHVKEEANIQLKILGAKKKMTAQEMLTEALNDFFSKNGLTRI